MDTIQEHEKYGNDGDRFFGAGRKLVDSYEGLANIINKLIDVSFEQDVSKRFNLFIFYVLYLPHSLPGKLQKASPERWRRNWTSTEQKL